MPRARHAPKRTGAGDHAVGRRVGAVHAEVGGAMGHEHAGLAEGALVDEVVDALAGGLLAALVLLFQASLAAACGDAGALGDQEFQALVHRGIDARHLRLVI